ncbi:MAG: hypothetical protein RJA55_276 [Acidobacteriota bacterium]
MASRMNPFEQHVEKIVLGAAVLGVIGVGVWEFGLNESTVSLGGRQVPISTVDGELDREAQKLQARLRDEAEAGVTLPELKQATSALFEERLAKGSGAGASLAASGPSFASALVKDGLAKDVSYHEPKFPAPTALLVQSTSDALTDEAKSTYSPYLGSAVSEGSTDITWITPSALINLEAMRAELASSGTGDAKAIPTRWWENTLLIADVVFERQERAESGAWGPTTVVDPVGTQLAAELSFRKDLDATPVPPELRGTVVETLKQASDQLTVLRPDFYPTKRGLWLEPNDAAPAAPVGVSPEELRRLRDLEKAQTELRKLEQQRAKLEAELKELGGRLDPPAGDDKKKDQDDKKSNGATGDGGGGGGGFGFGGGGGMKGRRDPNAGKDAENDKKRIQKTKQFDQVVKEIEAKKKQLTSLGGTAAQVEQATKQIDLAKEASVRVWTHDIAVSAGGTYRYRCTLKLLNPFLGKESVLTAGQQPLAKVSAIASATSAWSDAYTVPSDLAVFVTQASLRGRGEATVEVYRLHDGQRQVESFNVNPGDRIGDVASAKSGAADIDFTTDWFLVDIFVDPKAQGAEDAAEQAVVVLQDLNGKLIEYRVPRLDKDSGARASLSNEAKAAKAEASVAKPGAGAPPTDGVPAGPAGGPAGGPSGGT